MNLGVKIKELRKAHNLSQDAFAELFNVTRQTVSNWENQKSYPDLETIVTISQKFDTTVDELLKEDATFVKQIDGEKKKKNVLAVVLISAIFFFWLLSFSGYRYIKSTNNVSFNMKKSDSFALSSLADELDVAHGYFAVPRPSKIKLNIQGDIDSGKLTVIITDQHGQLVYRVTDDRINDKQVLQLTKGSYDIQITANDYTEKKLSFSYELSVNSQ